MYPQNYDPKKSAKVSARSLRVSRKNSVEIGRFIKGMKVANAKRYLEEVMQKKKAIPFARYTDSLGHKKGMGPGKYPVIAAETFVSMLSSVEKNAEYQGLETKKLIVKNVYVAKGANIMRPRRSEFAGQARKNTHISITVEEGN